jgi:Protein of unknown function (DUF3237)
METERRYLFKKSDSYLFSFDVSHRMTRAGRGWNLAFQPERLPVGFDVFNVRNESVVNDREALVGHVVSVVGRYDFRTYSDAAGTKGKMLIRARDGVVIESRYYGTQRLHELGQRTLLSATDPEPIEVKLSYWFRFDTTSPKYRWLVQSPCVGFGRAVITPRPDRDVLGFPDAFSFDTQVDVYALS